jgi:hypothetical protein
MGIHCAYFDAVCLRVLISCFVNVIFYISMFLTVVCFLYCVSVGYIAVTIIFERCFVLALLSSLESVNFLCSLRLHSRYCADGR